MLGSPVDPLGGDAPLCTSSPVQSLRRRYLKADPWRVESAFRTVTSPWTVEWSVEAADLLPLEIREPVGKVGLSLGRAACCECRGRLALIVHCHKSLGRSGRGLTAPLVRPVRGDSAGPRASTPIFKESSPNPRRRPQPEERTRRLPGLDTPGGRAPRAPHRLDPGW